MQGVGCSLKKIRVLLLEEGADAEQAKPQMRPNLTYCLRSARSQSPHFIYLHSPHPFYRSRSWGQTERGQAFLKVTHSVSSRGEFGTRMSMIFRQGDTLSCAGDRGAHLLGEHGEWLWCVVS